MPTELETWKKDCTYFYQRCQEYQADLEKERTLRKELEQRLDTIELHMRALVAAVYPDVSAPPDTGMTEDEVITKFWADHRNGNIDEKILVLSGPTKAGK